MQGASPQKPGSRPYVHGGTKIAQWELLEFSFSTSYGLSLQRIGAFWEVTMEGPK